jgi:hypothetical protein
LPRINNQLIYQSVTKEECFIHIDFRIHPEVSLLKNPDPHPREPSSLAPQFERILRWSRSRPPLKELRGQSGNLPANPEPFRSAAPPPHPSKRPGLGQVSIL